MCNGDNINGDFILHDENDKQMALAYVVQVATFYLISNLILRNFT